MHHHAAVRAACSNEEDKAFYLSIAVYYLLQNDIVW